MNEEVKQRSWFKRNWIWLVSASGCLIFIIIAILGIGTLFYGVTKIMTNSEPYEHAMEMTQNNVEVVVAIGEPIMKNGMTSGNISYKNENSEADLRIPVEGSKGRATVYVKAHKSGEDWVYEELYVLIKGTQEQINLLESVLEDF